MLRHGLHPKVVADRLGHSSTRMTLDVYAHVAPEVEEKAAGSVAAAIAAVANGTNRAPKPENATDAEKTKTAQSLAPQGVPMVGARGLEPLTPTVSRSVRSAIKRHFGRLKTNE